MWYIDFNSSRYLMLIWSQIFFLSLRQNIIQIFFKNLVSYDPPCALIYLLVIHYMSFKIYYYSCHFWSKLLSKCIQISTKFESVTFLFVSSIVISKLMHTIFRYRFFTSFMMSLVITLDNIIEKCLFHFCYCFLFSLIWNCMFWIILLNKKRS